MSYVEVLLLHVCSALQALLLEQLVASVIVPYNMNHVR
jgi:hypothetical protein